MTPSTRRRATLLMWLMLALLPLRGWAMGAMDAQQLAAPAALLAIAGTSAATDCHDADGDGNVRLHSLCSLCHTAVAPAPAVTTLVLHDAANASIEWIAHRRHQAPPSGLYEPPRI